MSIHIMRNTDIPGSLPTQWCLLEIAKRSMVVAAGNGSSDFEQVLGGTVMGKITASGKYRPCGKAPLAAVITGANEANVGAAGAPLFFDGDAVDILSKLGLKGSVEMTDLDGVGSSGESIDLESKELDGLAHRVTLSDPGGATQALAVTATIDQSTGIWTFDVSMETDGGSAIVTTLAECVSIINVEAGFAVNAELTAGATGSTVIVVAVMGNFDLAGGFAVGGTIASARTVSALVKATGVFTFSGAAATAAIGDVVQLADGSEDALGIMRDSIQTADKELASDGTVAHYDQGEILVTQGEGYEAEIIGLNVETRADLAGQFTYR